MAAPATGNRFFAEPAGWNSVAVPAALFIRLAGFLAAVAGSEVTVWRVVLVPSLSVAFGILLDGLSLGFALLIKGIGALVTLHATSWLGVIVPIGTASASFEISALQDLREYPLYLPIFPLIVAAAFTTPAQVPFRF
ncbi:Multiple resistance and pH homeostasis protein A [Jannaschia seosinensis]|uniref:Multiple resistance and pH homeostasis protein A n=1 Tax=Jannaschia seosinensis TaxID=313367 RepID=A0A0M7BFJ1_9RHOB|nr:hypothetical protein [Jannaschia seosinensis]CUH40145.1 Multiple resistance and pH homeostasis protein A [Jannaschia seosinensis]